MTETEEVMVCPCGGDSFRLLAWGMPACEMCGELLPLILCPVHPRMADALREAPRVDH